MAMTPPPPPHVLVLPYPSQGHINPMLQFAKRLASRGPKVTLVTTRFIISSVRTEAAGAVVALASISDGYDEGGVGAAASLDEYLRNLAEVGSRTLAELIVAGAGGHPFTCMVYDTYVPWAWEVAARLGLPAVAFSTQSCAASAIYYYVNRALLPVPGGEGSAVSVEGLPPMSRSEFPSFVTGDGVRYPTLAGLSLGQFSHLEKADWVLFNSVEELESEVLAGLKAYWNNARTVGPTLPSMFVDRSVDGDDDCYSVDLLQADAACIRWLDDKPPASVVYVSFGSFARLSSEQTAELAYGLRDAGHAFLWVLRDSELGKLPAGFLEEVGRDDRGMVVGWCPQLAVLAHGAVGCFVTHCGWNSTLEALSLGVPMVAVPQWTDQPTNAKMVEEVWGVGVRATHGGGGGEQQAVLSRAEIRSCVSQVMAVGDQRDQEMRSNAVKWKETVKKVLAGGGSSDRNMVEFVDFLNNVQQANSPTAY